MTPRSGPTIEVCLVTYKNRETIRSAIESAAHIPGNVSVAVHDNDPQSDTLSVARNCAAENALRFRGEYCDDNCGFGKACNSLARSSSAEYLFFLNPDAAIRSWAWPDLHGIVGAKILDDELSRHWGRTRTIATEIAIRWLRVRGRRPEGKGYVSGAAMLVHRLDFLSLGGFDEGYFMYYEDIDLCFRANAASVPVWGSDDISVSHIGGHSASKDPSVALIRSYESGLKFHTTHSGSSRAWTSFTVADAALRAGLYSLMRRRASAGAFVSLIQHALSHDAPIHASHGRVSRFLFPRAEPDTHKEAKHPGKEDSL
ncbi:MAG TPA: glycosyltransferase [Fimbriimonadaceae bacterium]|nr:glycosyltransferase [Fimbriimonadaceae bacterium]